MGSISRNIISSNDIGIQLTDSDNINITGNIITENNYGIAFYATIDSVISFNHIFSNKEIGILFTWEAFYGSVGNSVYYNIIQKNTNGIHLDTSGLNKINCNNFYQNSVDASFIISSWNNWNNNYWDRPRIFPKFPKPIIGRMFLGFPWINFDWHPATEPYDIPMIN